MLDKKKMIEHYKHFMFAKVVVLWLLIVIVLMSASAKTLKKNTMQLAKVSAIPQLAYLANFSYANRLRWRRQR